MYVRTFSLLGEEGEGVVFSCVGGILGWVPRVRVAPLMFNRIQAHLFRSRVSERLFHKMPRSAGTVAGLT